MSMKVTKLTTYWDADDAYSIISFLDELRDQLWATYGDEIIERQQALSQRLSENDRPTDSERDIEF